jgi:hypothetical protein
MLAPNAALSDCAAGTDTTPSAHTHISIAAGNWRKAELKLIIVSPSQDYVDYFTSKVRINSTEG